MHSFFIHEQWAGVRAVSQVLSMWPCIRELDKEKSRHAGLVQQNGFGLAFPQSMERLVKCIFKLKVAVDWLDSLISPGRLLLVVSHLFVVLVLVLRTRKLEKIVPKLGCEKYFCRVIYQHLRRCSRP